MLDLSTAVQYLKGVGPERARVFKNIGVETIDDLLGYYPRQYEDRRNIKLIAQLALNRPGSGVGLNEKATIQATVVGHSTRLIRRGQLLKITLSDGTGNCWLNCFNQPWLKDKLKEGMSVIVYGNFQRVFGRAVETSDFTYEVLEGTDQDFIHTNRIVPVYRLTEGLYQRWLRALIKRTLDNYCGLLKDFLPEELKQKYELLDYHAAILNIHFPEDFSKHKSARRRLAFEECFFFQLGLAIKRAGFRRQSKGREYVVKRTLLTPFRQNLGFEFTSRQNGQSPNQSGSGQAAQKTVINQLFKDLQSPYPMNRLLQGDVGVGKTVVAISCGLLIIENGYQCAIMAPTEVLAEQHYFYLRQFLKPLLDPAKAGLRMELLIGGMTKKRKEILTKTIDKIDLLVGTHALLEGEIKIPRLGLVIIDEQHKFGVLQRATLREKGFNPDVLVMTATPIPRTLALTAYGDLDISILVKAPPGRKQVQTLQLSPIQAYEVVRKEVAQGHQAYIVYPLIEESRRLKLKSAIEQSKYLKEEIFPACRIGLLHGRLSTRQKQQVSEQFRNHQIDILVTTTVIEVGMDIPNASVMVIQDCERFGLATLHQLRGRVGRGPEQSYCILVGNPKTQVARQRIEVFLKTTDGFKIAEEDLKLRGPGEFFGTRQHGLPEFKIVDLVKDQKLMQIARREAEAWLGRYPKLNFQLRQGLNRLFKARQDLIKVG